MQRPSESTMRLIAANLRAFTINAVNHNAAIRNPVVMSDEDLDYWGDFYVANHFAARGILFEIFMTDPFAIAQAVIFKSARDEPEFRPLLPPQRDVAMQFHPHRRAISMPLPVGESHFRDLITDGDDYLEMPAFLRRQAD